MIDGVVLRAGAAGSAGRAARPASRSVRPEQQRAVGQAQHRAVARRRPAARRPKRALSSGAVGQRPSRGAIWLRARKRRRSPQAGSQRSPQTCDLRLRRLQRHALQPADALARQRAELLRDLGRRRRRRRSSGAARRASRATARRRGSRRGTAWRRPSAPRRRSCPGRRQPSVRSTPSNCLTTSILPASTAKSARSPPSWTANSPGRRRDVGGGAHQPLELGSRAGSRTAARRGHPRSSAWIGSFSSGGRDG